MKKFLFKYKTKLALAIIFTIISSIIIVIESFFIKLLMDSTVNKDFQKLIYNIIIYLIFLFIQAIVIYLSKKFRYKYITYSIIYLKNELFTKIIDENITEFKSENSGRKISLLTNDVKILEDDLFNNIFILLTNLISFITAMISLFILSPEITFSVLIVICFVMIVPKIFGNRLTKIKKEYVEKVALFILKIKDTFSGIDIIKTFKLEEKIKIEYDSINKNTEYEKYKFNLLNSKVQLISEIILSMVFLVFFSVGGYLIFIEKITFGTIIACMQLLGSVSNPIYNSVDYINRIKSLNAIISKINTLYNYKVDKNLNENLKKENLKKCITISNLYFGYDSTKKILNNINLVIEKNKKYAIVGNSGSGKSTLFQLLLKNFNNYDGKILFDEISLNNISYESLYSLISIVHQNIFLFDTSIKENIVLYNKYCEEDLNNIIEKVNLSSMLEKLPNGINTAVGENGNNISGGEKQRIAIARALIRNVPILMLDEATSALDNEMSYDIENLILSLKDTTCLVISHRFNENILKKYDEIIVLREGSIVEKGSYNQLIKKQGYFYNLFNVYKES